jgi:hypothetical protein
LVFYLRILLVAVGATVILSACSLDQVLVIGGGETSSPVESGAAAAAPGSTASRDRAVKATTEAVGAQIVVKPGQYLLCSTTDTYKGRTTTYYVCRERRCVGQESPATGVGTLKNKSSCLSACRKSETKKGRDASHRTYCVV